MDKENKAFATVALRDYSWQNPYGVVKTKGLTIKEFIENIRSNIVGKEILKSIKPDQMIIKLVQDELIAILGSINEELNISKSGLTKKLFCLANECV